MPKYRYLKLRVDCLEPRYFAVTEMRAAVEHLKTIPDAKFVGLSAIAATVRAGMFMLGLEPFLKLDRIIGRPGKSGRLSTLR